MMNPIKRLRNLWFWSGISAQDVQDNPHSFVAQAINKQAIQGQGYIVGLNEEEQSFKDSLNQGNRDTKLS